MGNDLGRKALYTAADLPGGRRDDERDLGAPGEVFGEYHSSRVVSDPPPAPPR